MLTVRVSGTPASAELAQKIETAITETSADP